MTDELIKTLRADWPEILVEKHWMMDSDAIDKQREEAADRIEQLEREKAVVSDLWEQQKEIALDYLADCNKAVERIEALEAENERLRERVKRVENNNRELRGSKERVYAATDLRQPTQSNAEIIAENKRLREALAHIANTINIVGSPYHKAQEALDQIVTETKRAARAALQEQGK